MAVAGDAPFADAIAAQAARAAHATAIVQGPRRIGYGELARLIERAAAGLWHQHGIRAGERVAWLGANDAAQIVLLFALARIGAIVLPLNFRLAPAEWDALLAQCTPKLLVHDDGWARAATDAARRSGIASSPARELATGAAPPAPDQAKPEAPVLLVFTSGTTGR